MSTFVSELSIAPDASEQLSPHERLELLCDEGSVEVLRSEVTSKGMGGKTKAGDGIVGALGRIEGRPIFCYAQDAGYAGGSLGEAHADTIVRILELAQRARVPVIGFVESGGARLQEGLAALGGYGRIFHRTVALSGQVPQLTIITGTAAGGGAYGPALTDFVLMTKSAAMFLTGPDVVRDALGEDVTAQSLGGPDVHERNGVAHLVVEDEVEAAQRVREMLSYMPQSAGEPPPLAAPSDPDPGAGNPGSYVPRNHRKVYDVRDVIRAIFDSSELLEVSPRWARNLVTAFARLEGRPVGIVANQPRYLGGVLDAESSRKGARFVRFCDAFGIPLITLVDTPGFLPGAKQERAGVIRHGASFVHAFAAASVPQLTVVLRKSFGGAYITMNSKDLGADFTFAWPRAEMGVMSAGSAVSIIHRRDLAAAEDADATRVELSDSYADRHLGARVAAREGSVDELISPAKTRQRLCWGLDALSPRLSETRDDVLTRWTNSQLNGVLEPLR